MAVMINMQKNGIETAVPVGFSWTTLFFGFFVPLFRGDWLWVAIMLVLAACSLGTINFLLSFFYNRIYLSNLLNKGWVPADEYSYNTLRQKGILSK